MKRVIVAIALLLATTNPAMARQQPQPAGVQASTALIERAKLDGELAATNAGGWMGRSVVFGFLGGVIGTGITFAVAAGSSPDLPTEKKLAIAGESEVYKTMYEKGYADKVRGKHKKHALVGGLVGTAASIALILSLQSSSTGY